MTRVILLSVVAVVWATGCADESMRESQRFADAARSSVEVDRESAIADGVDGVVVTVTVRNEEGRPVADAVVVLSFDGERVVATATERTDAQGVTTTTVRTTVAQSVKVAARVLDVDFEQQPVVLFSPGAAARLGFGVSPGAGEAGEALAPAPEVEAFDAFDNRTACPGVVLALEGGNAAATLVGETQRASSGDRVVFADLVVDTAGDEFVLVASAPGLVPGRSEPFDVKNPSISPDCARIFATPEQAVANGMDAIALELLACSGREIPLAGEEVRWSSSGGSDVFADLVQTTDAEGRTRTHLSSTRAGVRTVTATVGGIDLTVDVTFVPGAPSQAGSTFEVAETWLHLNDGFFARLVLEVRDDDANAIAGVFVAFESTNPADVLSPAEGTTGADGRLEVLLGTKKDRLRQVTARVAGVEKTLDVQFSPLPADATHSTATLIEVPEGEAYDSDGHTYARIAVVARDRFDNVLSGLPVVFESVHLDLFFDGSATTTSANGVAVGQVASTREGTKVIRVVVDEARLVEKPQVTFRPINREWAHWPMVEPEKWALTVDGDVVRDGMTRLVWQRVLSSEKFTQGDAQSYCDALVLDGRDDWRLPTRIELISIASDSPQAFPGEVFPDAPVEAFWSATKNANATIGQTVQVARGTFEPAWPTKELRVRCVR